MYAGGRYNFYLPFIQDGQTALLAASRKGHDQIVELLLRRSSTVWSWPDVNHQTNVRVLMLVCVSHCVVTLQHIVNVWPAGEDLLATCYTFD